jgi:hypothetical protein
VADIQSNLAIDRKTGYISCKVPYSVYIRWVYKTQRARSQRIEHPSSPSPRLRPNADAGARADSAAEPDDDAARAGHDGAADQQHRRCRRRRRRPRGWADRVGGGVRTARAVQRRAGG